MAIQSKAEKKLDIHPIDKHLSCTAELAASPIHFYFFWHQHVTRKPVLMMMNIHESDWS